MTAARKLTAAPKPIDLAELLSHEGDATKFVGDRPLAWLVDPRLPRPDVLAFDLAKAGACFFLGAEHRFARVIDAKEARIDNKWANHIDAAIAHAKDAAMVADRRLLIAVEDTHLGSAASTPMAFAAVTRYGAAVSAFAAKAWVPVLRIPANRWQSKLLGKHPRDQGKVLSLARARQVFGGTITNDNVADAANLAVFVRGGTR